eukprot:1797756-Prymnesium_polylepis.1
MDLQFEKADLGYSNLGGLGPDFLKPHGIRYIAVGKVFTPSGATIYFDLEVTNKTVYSAFDSNNNTIEGGFARINLGPNTKTRLRLSVRKSCCDSDACSACDGITDPDAKADCLSGCCCFGRTCQGPGCCDPGPVRDHYRDTYACAGMDADFPLPPTALVSFGVFDIDGGPEGTYLETVKLDEYRYYKYPRYETVATTLAFDPDTREFSGSAPGSSSDHPTDPKNLTDFQASRAVQFFIAPADG